jgi:hypothetical protein
VEFGTTYSQEGFANLFDEHKIVNGIGESSKYTRIFLDFVYKSPPMTNKTILQS